MSDMKVMPTQQLLNSLNLAAQFAQAFQAVADLSPYVNQIVSIEQAVKESEKRLDAARTAENEQKARIEAMQQTAAETLAAAQAEAETIRASARGHYDEHLGQARDEADRVKAAATADAQGQIRDSEQKLSALTLEVARHQDKLGEVINAVTERQKVHDALQAHIDELKAKFS